MTPPQVNAARPLVLPELPAVLTQTSDYDGDTELECGTNKHRRVAKHLQHMSDFDVRRRDPVNDTVSSKDNVSQKQTSTETNSTPTTIISE